MATPGNQPAQPRTVSGKAPQAPVRRTFSRTQAGIIVTGFPPATERR